ncbi:MAG: TolC family protein [Candidatus Kapabacteria bacterium]|jgi:outer membrane protein TolC|nr:TolC family protein [Candidatus Kapabacteria bacterium]
MRKKIVGIFALSAIISSQIVHAQTMTLTLEEALQKGKESSRQLKIAESKVVQAKEMVDEAASNRLPTLKFQGGYTRLSDVPAFTFSLPFGNQQEFTIAPVILNNYQLRLSVQQPIYTGNRIESMVDAARYSAQAAEIDKSRDQYDVSYTIKNSYWTLYRAVEFKKVVEESIEMLKARIKDAEVLEKNGMLTRNDILKIQVQLSDATIRLIEAENNIQLSTVALNNALGQPLGTVINASTQPRDNATAMATLDNMILDAKKSRADIQATEYRIKAAQENISAQQSNYYPQIFVGGNVYYNNPNQRILPNREQFDATWDLGVQVSMDLWNWGQTANKVGQAEAQFAQAKESLGLLQDAINVEVTQAYLTMRQMSEKINVAKQTVEQATENQRVTAQRFKNGIATSTDALDADFTLMQSKVNYTQALVDFEMAFARLRKAQGLE